MKTTQQKNLAEQEKSMFDAKKDAEQRRIEFERTKAEADAQVKIISAEAGIKVAQHEARQVEERAKGDAAQVRLAAEAEAGRTKQVGDAEASVVQSKGEAQAKAYRDQVDALTASGVTAVEVMKAVAAAGLVLASVIFSFPFMVHPVQSALQSLPASLSEAACTLGKSRWQVFLNVLLPNIRPALLGGAVLSFTHTIGEFGVVLMIGGSLPGETRVASIAIYDEVESLNYAAAHFYALVLFVVCFFTLLAVYLLTRRGVRAAA